VSMTVVATTMRTRSDCAGLKSDDMRVTKVERSEFYIDSLVS
jgi:hypothetical protein